MENAPEDIRKAFRFRREDREKLEEIAKSIGRCHDNINKIEQLHSMKDVYQKLDNNNTLVSLTMDQSVEGYSNMKECMRSFTETARQNQHQTLVLHNLLAEVLKSSHSGL